MPLLHKYNELTKEYIGSLPACEDPMASKRKGETVYAILRNSTFKEPTFEEGKVPVFNGEEWELLEDNRGRIVYNKDNGEPFKIERLGCIPKGYSLEKPILLQDLKYEKILEVKNAFSKEIDKEIELKGIKVNISSRGEIGSKLAGAPEGDLVTLEDKDTSEDIVIKREDLEYISRYLYLREILLSVRKNEIIRNINACKFKKSIKEVTVNFDITNLVEGQAGKSMKDIEEYIKGLVGE